MACVLAEFGSSSKLEESEDETGNVEVNELALEDSPSDTQYDD